ncbi:hypothetical protein J2W23_006279 [Variovorax boronicumulans]|uniref:hypothetical protein n=1 Tax=Variovorax boronicumulans TaxID=436515 RepID=UPI00277EBD7B|nr:hypothetical protein [Variovorax boronicumulans]MDQ0017858.1 hypothetical protein [Variovorax boronicumulans]
MSEDQGQKILLRSVGGLVEEELVVECKGVLLVCFASNYPRDLVIGNEYLVKLSLMVFDEFKPKEVSKEQSKILQLSGGFDYEITGKILHGVLHSEGFAFENEILESEFTYLEGSTISLTANRVNIKFL